MGDTDDSATTLDGTQPDAAAAAADAAKAGSDSKGGSDDSTLASRYAGQTAKVNILTTEKAQAIADRDAALARLAAYEAGKVDADEALKSQLAAEKANTEAARREAALARVEAKYPETFAELGDDAATLTEEKLASMEARLKGVAQDDTPPVTPRRPNGPQNQGAGTEPPKAETGDDIEARMRKMTIPWGKQ